VPNWHTRVQDRRRWKEVVEKAKTLHQELYSRTKKKKKKKDETKKEEEEKKKNNNKNKKKNKKKEEKEKERKKKKKNCNVLTIPRRAIHT